MTKPTLIEQAKQALEGTTPGPWALKPADDLLTSGIDGADGFKVVWPAINGSLEGIENDADAALIALAPQVAEALIAAEEMAEALRKVFSTHQNLDDFERLLAAHAAYRKATEGAE